MSLSFDTLAPERRLARASFAAALSARSMRLGDAMVASRTFAAAGFVVQCAAARLRALAERWITNDLGLGAREAGAALWLLGVAANDLHPQEFLREAEALTAAAQDLCDAAPGEDLVARQSLVSLREVCLHLHEVARESAAEARGA